MKTVKWRASGSDQTCAKARMKGGGAGSVSVAASGSRPSRPRSASSAITKATAHTAAITATSRAGEYGSSSLPALPAVTAKPKIIIIQTMVAAGARRASGTRLASSTSVLVPAALTPMPTTAKQTNAAAMPRVGCSAIQAVEAAAPTAPSASTHKPPTIHGVRRPPTSLPKPMRGRNTCTA